MVRAPGLGSTGIATRTGKARWDRSTIWGTLRNPAYAGRACFGKTGRLSEQAGRNRVARLAGRAAGRAYTTVDRPRGDWLEIDVPALVDEIRSAPIRFGAPIGQVRG